MSDRTRFTLQYLIVAAYLVIGGLFCYANSKGWIDEWFGPEWLKKDRMEQRP